MSVQSCAGIILAANGNASSGYAQLPSGGTLVSPGSVLVNISHRVVLTLSVRFAKGTSIASYALKIRMSNNNTYGTIANGKAVFSYSGSINTDLDVSIGVGSIAQASDAPFIQQITQTYVDPGSTDNAVTVIDIITLPGFLVGLLDVLLTTGGAPSATDRVTLSVDLA